MGSLLSHLPPTIFHTPLLFLVRQILHRIPPFPPSLSAYLSQPHGPTELPSPLRTRTLLLTGFTSGLGYATAVLLLRLNIPHLVLVARNEKRALEGLERLRNDPRVGGVGGERLGVKRMEGGDGYMGERVSLLWCDQGRIEDVVAFGERMGRWKEVRRRREMGEEEGLDAVVLNVGVIPKKWEVTADGWEVSLQVNLLTTSLMAMILLPYLTSPSGRTEDLDRPSRLVVINSDSSCFWPVSALTSSPPGRLLSSANKPSNLDLSPADFQKYRYSATKALLLLFTLALARKVEERRQQEPQGRRRKVVILSATPGLCKTEILANMPKEHGAFAEKVGWDAEDGARAFVSCAVEEKGEGWNGKLVVSGLVVRPGKIMCGKKGQGNQDRVFDEVVGELRKVAPGVVEAW